MKRIYLKNFAISKKRCIFAPFLLENKTNSITI